MEKASVPFLLDALRVCMGYKRQDHHREVFPSCTKPPLKKPKNNNPFCKILVYTDSTRASLQGSIIPIVCFEARLSDDIVPTGKQGLLYVGHLLV